MLMSHEELVSYARLIVRIGANVQPGQPVNLVIATDQTELAREITRECYEAGARHVDIDWTNAETDVLTYQYATEETLSTVLPWQEEKARQRTVDLPVSIYVDSDDPDAMAAVDPAKMSKVRQARMKVLKKYRDQIDGHYQWVIVSIPSPAWAKKVFPGETEEVAMAKLWEAIKKTVYLEGDPVANWTQHKQAAVERAAWLNSLGLVKLEYHSANGTDFTVGLIPGALWAGANDKNRENGVYYTPNMPTEEIFTSPMAGIADGTVVATKPLSYQGQLIEDFSVTFRDGKAVEVKAAKGQELLEKMITMDETACLLGEVALVPKESPINQTGILFYNTLFDENACCHLALGFGFPEVLPGFDGTPAEAQEQGVNDSIIHVDFMIGSDDLSITGIRADGSREPIFVDGTWVK